MGGQYTDGPDFRFLHSGEMAGCLILGAFILRTYFNNFPRFGNLALSAAIRTVLAIGIGVLTYAFYYSPPADSMLGKVAGVAQPGDTPLVWLILFISVILVHGHFFDAWPLRRRRGCPE